MGGYRAVDDIKFDIKHFSDTERLAMIGDKKWEKSMATFCKFFTKTKTRYFEATEIEEAHLWLEGGIMITAEL